MKLFNRLLILSVLVLTIINCEDNSINGLKESDVVNLWNFKSAKVSRSVSVTGQTVYYFTGITGVIYDTVTVDTSLTSSEQEDLNVDENFLNLTADKKYQLALVSIVNDSITFNDSGSWEFDEINSSLSLSSYSDTVYNLYLNGNGTVTSLLINEAISYDTLIRVDNVAVQCKALGTVARTFLVE